MPSPERCSALESAPSRRSATASLTVRRSRSAHLPIRSRSPSSRRIETFRSLCWSPCLGAGAPEIGLSSESMRALHCEGNARSGAHNALGLEHRCNAHVGVDLCRGERTQTARLGVQSLTCNQREFWRSGGTPNVRHLQGLPLFWRIVSRARLTWAIFGETGDLGRAKNGAGLCVARREVSR
jgi:hypothetical protein